MLDQTNKKEPSSFMLTAFRTGGAHCPVECTCGVVNFPDSHVSGSGYFNEDVERLKHYEGEQPDKYYCHDQCNSIVTYEINGNVFAFGCPCNALRIYEEFLLRNKENILQYYLLIKEYRRRADEMLDQIKE
jgi:hypothetical protein